MKTLIKLLLPVLAVCALSACMATNQPGYRTLKGGAAPMQTMDAK